MKIGSPGLLLPKRWSMEFFSKKKRNHEMTEHKTTFWDDELYSSIFYRKESEYEKVNGRGFSCELTRRVSSMRPYCVTHIYWGMNKVFLDDSIYGIYLVELEFSEPTEWATLNAGENEIGFMVFSAAQLPSGEELPSINIVLVDKYSLSENVSRLFIEAKTVATKGLVFQWRAILTPFIGVSAEILKSKVGQQKIPLTSSEFNLNLE